VTLFKRSSDDAGDSSSFKDAGSSSSSCYSPSVLVLNRSTATFKMTVPEEVDIIIVGGGSSGCVPAGRLANLDHKLQVLVIEGGENNLNNPW
jgi:GMC oxidoreductase